MNTQEVYKCANPDTCPHALHTKTVDEYKALLAPQAQMNSRADLPWVQRWFEWVIDKLFGWAFKGWGN